MLNIEEVADISENWFEVYFKQILPFCTIITSSAVISTESITLLINLEILPKSQLVFINEVFNGFAFEPFIVLELISNALIFDEFILRELVVKAIYFSCFKICNVSINRC